MEYDYVVVGTGSAGSVVAARLAEIEDATTLVLEAGGKDLNPWIHIPVGFVKTLNNKRVNWDFAIEPESYTHDRDMRLPRGRVVGGSSSINGMLYVRGNARDYDDWAQFGNRGWSYADVLPYFKKSERRVGAGDADYRGSAGPLTVSDIRTSHELMEAVIRAGEEIGYPHNPDYNGASQDGFSFYQVTQKNGVRQSTYRAFLKPALQRRNLRLLTRAFAHRVVLEGGRAVGIAFERGGEMHTVRARREVILAAGAVQSPQLLELSGIGRPEILAEQGIDVAHALPGVGENYRDHYMVRMIWRINRPITLNEATRGLSLWKAAVEFAFARRGVLTFPTAGVAGFVRTRPEIDLPDVQYHIAPASWDNPQNRRLERKPGLSIGSYQTRPESLGSIHIASAEPQVQPRIKGNYLSVDYDRTAAVGGLRIARALMTAQAISGYVEREIEPGGDVQRDDEFLDYARQTGTGIYHPVGTCKMGSDPMAVVDDRLRVHGIDGLRVIDASVMPIMTSGNTHAPTMMIAERGSDLIKETWKAS